jgi:hypothetical protein
VAYFLKIFGVAARSAAGPFLVHTVKLPNGAANL